MNLQKDREEAAKKHAGHTFGDIATLSPATIRVIMSDPRVVAFIAGAEWEANRANPAHSTGIWHETDVTPKTDQQKAVKPKGTALEGIPESAREYILQSIRDGIAAYVQSYLSDSSHEHQGLEHQRILGKIMEHFPHASQIFSTGSKPDDGVKAAAKECENHVFLHGSLHLYRLDAAQMERIIAKHCVGREIHKRDLQCNHTYQETNLRNLRLYYAEKARADKLQAELDAMATRLAMANSKIQIISGHAKTQ